MNVLSLFDGISCGLLAFKRSGIKIENYFSSEIDKFAIKISKVNHPEVIQLGDIRNIKNNIPKIDMIIGGSPCQGFSNSGKKDGFNNSQSFLFYEYVRMLEIFNPDFFLFENVKMKNSYKNEITKNLKVNPIEMNSSLVSVQNRNRLYWTNIQNIRPPKDRNILWRNIKESNAAAKYYYSDVALKWFDKHIKNGKKFRIIDDDGKIQTIEATYYKKYSLQRFFGIKDFAGLRFITPLECERAQTLPDNYTNHVSDTQRYKMIGNGWTVDIISHILNCL